LHQSIQYGDFQWDVLPAISNPECKNSKSAKECPNYIGRSVAVLFFNNGLIQCKRFWIIKVRITRNIKYKLLETKIILKPIDV